MRYLTALEYLSQLKILDIQIDQDIERLSEMKLSAIDSGVIDHSPVTSSVRKLSIM